MLGEEEEKPSITRRTYSRSVSWTDRSPNNRKPPPPPGNSKPRPLLPPLQPLSINKCSVEEWPSVGSDDLGVWPLLQTPRGPVRAYKATKDFQFKRDKLAFFDKECPRISPFLLLARPPSPSPSPSNPSSQICKICETPHTWFSMKQTKRAKHETNKASKAESSSRTTAPLSQFGHKQSLVRL